MNNFEKFKRSKVFKSNLYELGVLEERLLLPKLRLFFNDDSIHHLPEGHQFDYEGDNKIIELKTRSVASTTYKDTAIGNNKISYAKHYNGKVYFVFKFTDGIYYFEYNQNTVLREYPINGISHYFIPISELKTMILESN